MKVLKTEISQNKIKKILKNDRMVKKLDVEKI